MITENLLMHLVGFIAAMFVLRLARFTFSFAMQSIEDPLRENFPENDTVIRDFFLKVDYVVNGWTLFKIGIYRVRWHYIVAFLYVITR
jgi:hypothetical protein